MKSWSDIGFEIEITGDGSPSLRLLASVDPEKYKGESMHHSGGACAETLLIYGTPIRQVLEKVENPRFLIVGLGLGYIELVIAREALLLGKSAAQVSLITSYESVLELKEFFFKWLHGKKEELSIEVWNTYDSVLNHVIAGTELTAEVLKSFLTVHFKTLSDIQDAITNDVCLPSKYHCILYDAFSSKTNPFLWEEEFLTGLLHLGAAEQCVLSTYACKGSLKRALRKEGFEVVVREGFQGKRNSTLGIKNISI
ncbi:MAG: MnmC family methyltransferase [Bdellovibrio sp.]